MVAATPSTPIDGEVEGQEAVELLDHPVMRAAADLYTAEGYERIATWASPEAMEAGAEAAIADLLGVEVAEVSDFLAIASVASHAASEATGLVPDSGADAASSHVTLGDVILAGAKFAYKASSAAAKCRTANVPTCVFAVGTALSAGADLAGKTAEYEPGTSAPGWDFRLEPNPTEAVAGEEVRWMACVNRNIWADVDRVGVGDFLAGAPPFSSKGGGSEFVDNPAEAWRCFTDPWARLSSTASPGTYDLRSRIYGGASLRNTYVSDFIVLQS